MFDENVFFNPATTDEVAVIEMVELAKNGNLEPLKSMARFELPPTSGQLGSPELKRPWKIIGSYRVLGSMTDWRCDVSLKRDSFGNWRGRWRGEEGAEEILGPGGLREIFDELVHLGADEDDLLRMMENSDIARVREFVLRRKAIDSMKTRDLLAEDLMEFWRPNNPVRLEARWADDAAVSKIRIEPDDWLRIAEGKSVDLGGSRYRYEGAAFSTCWKFNFRKRGQVLVTYVSSKNPENAGEGYEGGIKALVQSRA